MPEAIWVAWNPAAGSADKAGELRSTLEARLDCILRETSTREEIVEFARAGAQDGARMVVAAGGDGTVNAVVNGLDAAGRPEVPLAVLPLGTGNDLCRTLAIPDDPAEALDLLATGVVQRIDRVRAESPSLRMHYVNMGSGGFSAQVVQAADGDLKKRWGPLAYLRGAAQTAGDLTQYHVRVQVDDQPAVHLALYNIILANGRTTSRGLLLAPRANPQDGLLEVMLVPGSGLTDMAKLAAQWLAGRHLEADQLVYLRGARVSVESAPPMPFSLDGDLATDEPLVFTVDPQSLAVVVGPQYTAEP